MADALVWGSKPIHWICPTAGGDRRLMTAQLCGAGNRTSPPERGTMYLSTVMPAAAAALKAALDRAGLSISECDPGVFAVPFSARRIDSWRSIFSGVFSPTELSTVKCVVLPAGTDAASAELMQSECLAQFLQWLEGQWLVGVLEAQRLMSVFQPIVHTDDPQNIYAYECLLRGRTANGQWIMPDRLFAARMPACSNG